MTKTEIIKTIKTIKAKENITLDDKKDLNYLTKLLEKEAN